ncbi:MAG: type II secretion system protein J [Planctomycetota bacterium]
MNLRSGKAAPSGFTLIEILVSLAITALVMTSILGSLDVTQKAVDAIHNVIETEAAGPRILALLRDDLSHLAVYDAPDWEVLRGSNDSIGGADADRLDFLVSRRTTRPYRDYTRVKEEVWAPLAEVGYWLRGRPGSPDFLELYRREDWFQDEEPFDGGSFTLLYNRITNWEIRYFAQPEVDPSWDEEWDTRERQGLPYAIEIQLELEIQPRRSLESLGILGANRSRLEFSDILTLPETTRWVFRQRIHPVIPTPESAGGTPVGAGGPGSRDGDSGPGQGLDPSTGAGSGAGGSGRGKPGGAGGTSGAGSGG